MFKVISCKFNSWVAAIKSFKKPIYIYRFSGKEKQLFWNLKFHAALSTIFSQLTLMLNCYSAIVSSWRHLISLIPEWKTHPNPVMTQHIRERSRNPPNPKWEMGQGTWHHLYLCQNTVGYFSLPNQWCSIVSERPSGKNCITQGPVHRFVSLINLLIPTWHKSPPEVIWEHTLV